MATDTPSIDPTDPVLKAPAALNPYVTGGIEILRRLRWDLRLESWRSRAKLRRLKDAYRGQRAVVLCNGPSLNRVDFDLLRGTYCFGLNKIHLLFDRTSFRPSAIVAMNPEVIRQAATVYDATDIPLFLHRWAINFVRPRSNRIFIPSSSMTRYFARDCSMSVYGGHTVTYAALQLAYHMGFERVALVGCDHYFQRQGVPNKTQFATGTDPDHFDPNYFADVTWDAPDLFESEISYRTAYNVYRASGRQLVNATEGGKLEILPRLPLKDFLA